MDTVILDGYTINPGDLSWGNLEELSGRLTVFDTTPEDKIISRCSNCEILITSKNHITGHVMAKCPKLKYIGSTATGYNNIDIDAAANMGIAVTNVPSYATEAVAQHTMALILELTNHVGIHHMSVAEGQWSESKYFCYWKKPVTLLAGKSIGIIGYGAIGKRVGKIAEAFGMTVNVYSKEPAEALKSDFVSIHCPLTKDNAKMVNSEFLVNMKPGSFLINTSRGGLVDERALAESLKAGFIAGAALDVLEKEPPSKDCPLIGMDNVIITPHMAWVPREMRQKVIDTVTENLKSWLDGGRLNRVV